MWALNITRIEILKAQNDLKFHAILAVAILNEFILIKS